MPAQILKDGPDAHIRAADVLKAGGLVGLPTETVYGLAGDARSDATIAAIYAAKGRPSHNPLIVHVLKPEDVARYAELNNQAVDLMVRFWPGPLTLVLPRRPSDLAPRAASGLETIAVRCPDAPWREGLITAGWTGPLVMPSANRSGHVSPTLAQHVMEDLGDAIDLIIDNGPCRRGLESTVVSLAGEIPTLLRNGAIPRADIEAVVGPLAEARPDAPLASPGMMSRHYAPEAPLRLNAKAAKEGETLIGFGPEFGAPNLSPKCDLEEAASQLYRMLRELDGPAKKLAIAPIPEAGLGAAINDRLRRAALGR